MRTNVAAAIRRGEKTVADFNKQFTPNSPCFYQPVRGEDKWYPTRTRSEAWILGHGEPVVKIDGASGCVCISHLAMPGSDRYEASICEAEDERDAHYTQRFWTEGDLAEDEELQLVDSPALPATIEVAGIKMQLPAGTRPGQVSDGYHTFDDLYAHRCRLFVTLMRLTTYRTLWSHHHSDGSTYEGWILAGILTPAGWVTYHLPVSEVANLTMIQQVDRAPEWDGHTSDDVIERLLTLS